VPDQVDAVLGDRVADLGERGGHGHVGDVRARHDPVRALAGQVMRGFDQQVVGVAVATLFGTTPM
jgi:hypothetical protein